MNMQDHINVLKKIIVEDDDELADAIKASVETMRKEIPQPMGFPRIYDDLHTIVGRCPRCSETAFLSKGRMYCQTCGQLLSLGD